MIKNHSISLNQSIKQVPGNIVSDMDGEKVMLSVTNGKYYNLGDMGGNIWDILSESNTFKQLIEKLTDEYNVESSECEEQVAHFLELLLSENLITVA
jgi:hypothetical protein